MDENLIVIGENGRDLIVIGKKWTRMLLPYAKYGKNLIVIGNKMDQILIVIGENGPESYCHTKILSYAKYGPESYCQRLNMGKNLIK